MIEPETGTINQHGSNKGVQFLLQNETVALKFMDFFGKANVNYRVGVVEKKEGGQFFNKRRFYPVEANAYTQTCTYCNMPNRNIVSCDIKHQNMFSVEFKYSV